MKKEIICIICSLFCFGYCLLVLSVRSGTHFYLVWAAGGIFFIALGFFLHFDMWNKMPGALRKAAVCVILIVGLLFVVVEGCIISGFGAKGEKNLDYIIVLGAKVKQSGPSAVLKFRLDAAYDYLIENENTICIVSGGQGHNEPFSEAQGMYDYLIGRGIEPQRIIMEDKSTDTSQNIAFSSEFLDKDNDRVGIVTNNFHVFRGVHLARHQGIRSVCGISAHSDIFFLLNNMVREFAGVMKDLICGNLI